MTNDTPIITQLRETINCAENMVPFMRSDMILLLESAKSEIETLTDTLKRERDETDTLKHERDEARREVCDVKEERDEAIRERDEARRGLRDVDAELGEVL